MHIYSSTVWYVDGIVIYYHFDFTEFFGRMTADVRHAARTFLAAIPIFSPMIFPNIMIIIYLQHIEVLRIIYLLILLTIAYNLSICNGG